MPESAPSIRYVDVDGVRLRTSVRGAGPPLLLLTGIGASMELSVPLERELDRLDLQTIALDAPGRGGSTRYPRRRRMPGIARTVERILDALGHDRVDVLGVSFDGVVAQQLARQVPTWVQRLVLAATAAGAPFLGGVPGSPGALLALATARRYQSPDYYRRVAGPLYGGAARQDPDALLHGSAARFAEAPTVSGYLDQLYAIACWTGLPWLWRLRQPTLVLAGDDRAGGGPRYPGAKSWFARTMAEHPDEADGGTFTSLDRFVMELFRTISPNGGSLSTVRAQRGLEPRVGSIVTPIWRRAGTPGTGSTRRSSIRTATRRRR